MNRHRRFDKSRHRPASTSSVQYRAPKNQPAGVDCDHELHSPRWRQTEHAASWACLKGDWQERLAYIVDAMREMSLQTEAQEMVRSYGSSGAQSAAGGSLAFVEPAGARGTLVPDHPVEHLDRGDRPLEAERPACRSCNGGLLADLIYGDEPRLIDDIAPLLAADDPAIEYLSGFRSLMAVPHYDQGVALNMVITLQPESAAFDPETFPEWFWVSSLFGRVTHNLVLREELKDAYEIVERELKVVADIQRSLLPQVLPTIPDSRAGGVLPHVAVGRRRLLRLFPVAGRALGDLDRGRQRPRNARGRHDGDHAQPGPQPARARRTRRPRCWDMSTGSFPITIPPPTRCSSRRFTGSTTRRLGRSPIRARATTHRG